MNEWHPARESGDEDAPLRLSAREVVRFFFDVF